MTFAQSATKRLLGNYAFYSGKQHNRHEWYSKSVASTSLEKKCWLDDFCVAYVMNLRKKYLTANVQCKKPNGRTK
jgi:hypothetical protein